MRLQDKTKPSRQSKQTDSQSVRQNRKHYATRVFDDDIILYGEEHTDQDPPEEGKKMGNRQRERDICK